jgi:hypothetical protein
MRASSCCCCCSFWLRMLMLGPPHTARGYCFSLSLLRPPGLRSFFGFLFVRLFLIAHQIDFDSLLIRSRILTHLFLFSLFFYPFKKQNTNSAIFPVCVLVLFLFFCLAASAILFFYLIFSPPLSVCVAYSSYFLFLFYFLCGVGFSLPFWLCPGLDGHQTMRRRRRMTAIWSLSTPPTRNGRLCLSSRHYRSVAKLSSVSCQSTKKKKKSNNTYVCVCV